MNALTKSFTKIKILKESLSIYKNIIKAGQHRFIIVKN